MLVLFQRVTGSDSTGDLQLSDFTFSTDLSGPVDMYIRQNVKRGINGSSKKDITFRCALSVRVII